MPFDVLVAGEEKGEGDDGVNDGDTNGNGPAGLLACAVDGVDEFDDGENEEEKSGESYHRETVVVCCKEGVAAKKKRDDPLEDEDYPVRIDVFTVDMRHVYFLL